MMSSSIRSSVLWDGERINGGEPRWFSQAVFRGMIERSGEGCGTLLFVQAANGSIQAVHPGDKIDLLENGSLIVEKASAQLTTRNKIAPRLYIVK